MQSTDVLKIPSIQVSEIAAPGTPASGYGHVYAKTDGLLYFKNDAGTEYNLTAAVAGSDTWLQYNDAGSFGASDKLVVDKTNGRIAIRYAGSTQVPLAGLHVYGADNTAASIRVEQATVGNTYAHLDIIGGSTGLYGQSFQDSYSGLSTWNGYLALAATAGIRASNPAGGRQFVITSRGTLSPGWVLIGSNSTAGTGVWGINVDRNNNVLMGEATGAVDAIAQLEIRGDNGVLPALVVNAAGSATGDTRIGGDTDPNLFFVDASTDRAGFGTNLPAAKVDIVGGTLPSTIPALGVSATLSSTVGAQYAAIINATGAGAGAGQNFGLGVYLAAGYTGSINSQALEFVNSSAGTGADIFVSFGNIGIGGYANGTTVGHNAAGLFDARNSSTMNVGVQAAAKVASAGRNVGLVACALNGANNTAGFFGLYGTAPPLVNAALIADNGAVASPIFLGRDNGTTVFTVADGSGINSFGSSEVVFNDGGSNIDFRVEGDTNANLFFIDASTDRIGSGTLTPSFPLHLVTTANGLIGAEFDSTVTGADTGARVAAEGYLHGTYTGTGSTLGLSGYNSVPGSGTSLYVDTANFNAGFWGAAVGAGTGYNVGVYGVGNASSSLNIGMFGSAPTHGFSASLPRIGVMGNAESTTMQIGGYFSLRATSAAIPTFTSAALIADNDNETSPIFLARDNGTAVFTIADGGAVAVGIDGSASTPAVTLGATADPDTGWLHPAANTQAWSVGGSEGMRLTTTGLGIGGTPAAKADVNGDLATRAASPAALAATENDYAGAAGFSFARLSGAGGGSTVTGIAGGVDGRFLVVVNISANTITINHQDLGSAAANRVITSTGVAVILTADDAAFFMYDATTSRWRQITGVA